MRNNTLALVREWHRAFGVPDWSKPIIPDAERCDLRMELLNEELQELQDAVATKDIVEILDALCDLQYVLDGTFLEFGMGDIKMNAFNEVHRSNMSKLGDNGLPVKRADGKVLKGPNYSEPKLKIIIEQAGG